MLYIKENYELQYGKNPDASSYGKPSDLVIKIKDFLPGGKILDLGAGDGRQALYLAAQGFDVTAVDLSEAGLEKLKRLAQKDSLHINTLLADLHSWSIQDKYDGIIAIAVMQHLQHDTALRILNEMKMHTVPGGINVLTLFTQTGDRYTLDKEEDPEAFYPKDGWIQEYYSDWDIRAHDVMTTTEKRQHPKTNIPLQNTIERVFAQRPQLV